MKGWIDSRLLGIAGAVVLPGAIAYACMNSLFICSGNENCVNQWEDCDDCTEGVWGTEAHCNECCAAFFKTDLPGRTSCKNQECL